MKWAEVSVRTSHEAMDLVASLMEDVGAAGVVMDDPALVNEYIRSGKWDFRDMTERRDATFVTVKAYLPMDDGLTGKIDTIRVGMLRLLRNGVDTTPGDLWKREVDDEDWANEWKKYFHTEKIGERIVIVPTWESYEANDGEIVLRLDPGAAFGTGTHPTTAMCLRALERLVKPDMETIDIGTGSGVLAIAAAKLGASRVTAVDYSETAVKVARENVEQNGVAGVVKTGASDLLKNVATDKKVPLITANLIADLIIRLFDEDNDENGLSAHLTAGGKLLASGIITSRADEVKDAAEKHGYKVAEQQEDKDWVMMIIERQ